MSLLQYGKSKSAIYCQLCVLEDSEETDSQAASTCYLKLCWRVPFLGRQTLPTAGTEEKLLGPECVVRAENLLYLGTACHCVHYLSLNFIFPLLLPSEEHPGSADPK